MGKNDNKMAMTAAGLKLMIGGLLVMAAGFILLAGGGSDDPQVFNYATADSTPSSGSLALRGPG